MQEIRVPISINRLDLRRPTVAHMHAAKEALESLLEQSENVKSYVLYVVEDVPGWFIQGSVLFVVEDDDPQTRAEEALEQLLDELLEGF